MNFLSKEVVLNVHTTLITLFGGSDGVRDDGLLDSALAQPRDSFGGQQLHTTVWDTAAAYGFHLAKNHPFIDGNKRIAAVAMGTFLGTDGYRLTATESELFILVSALAAGECSKEQLSVWLEANAAPR